MSGTHADSERPPQAQKESFKEEPPKERVGHDEALDALTSSDSVKSWGLTTTGGVNGGLILIALVVVVVAATAVIMS